MPHQRLFVLLAFLSTGVHAQWLNFPTPGTPRTRDGKPNLAAPAPRTAGGQPDLSCVWMHETTTVDEVKRIFGNRFDNEMKVNGLGMEIGTQHKYAFNILLAFKPGDLPMRPEAAEIMRRRAVNAADVFAADGSRAGVCMGVAGFPLADLLSQPMKIVQSPRVTVILYEVGNLHRQIFTDGRTLPKEFDKPAYMGYSAGRWERDTLVVETAGFNDKTRLDMMGHPHSEALRVTERYHRRDFGHLDLEMTFDDPEMYTKPFTIRVPHELVADFDIFEMFCNENEKDHAHLDEK